MAATLKDVAELAGVSIATVSRVLNDPEKVAEQSRGKVLAAIETLGYSSNLLAKSLRQDGLNAVYVLLPSLSDPYFAQMHQGISDVLSSYDYLMLSVSTEDNRELELEYLTKAKTMGSSGVLIYTTNDPAPGAWNSFAGSFPTLFLSGNPVQSVPYMDSLRIDRRELGIQAATYLLQKGRRNFICLCENPSGLEMECLEGIQAAAEAQGGSCRICRASRAVEDAARELGRIWDQCDPAVDCILAQSTLQAVGALVFLRARGIAVPDQVSVMSFENSELACLTTPQLSVIGPSGYQVGVVGAKQLLDWIRNWKEDGTHWRGELDLNLIPRGSTDVGK